MMLSISMCICAQSGVLHSTRRSTLTMTSLVTTTCIAPIHILSWPLPQAGTNNPSRADFFTGTSSTVMKARRHSIRTSMKPKAARNTRFNTLAKYQELQAALSTHRSPLQESRPLGRDDSYNCLDVDMDASNDMDMDITDGMNTDGASTVSCMRGTICSARTKPVAKN